MRFREFLKEDPQTKTRVIRGLNKLPDDNPIFSDVYKMIISSPLSARMDAYINNRGDKDAIAAMKWLLTAIPTIGTSAEVKDFLGKFKDPNVEFINIKAMVPASGMDTPAAIADLVTDPFASKLFNKIFHEFAGKGDAGPGEAALAILSPNITYGQPGDIVIGSKTKVEVKAARSAAGKGGRIWDRPVHLEKSLKILAQAGMPTGFSVLDGTNPKAFADPKMAKAFIREACIAWFGNSIPEIEKAFGTPNFKSIWQAHMFDVYKAHGQWQGMLAIGVSTYQYIVSGEQFANNMAKAEQGTICQAGVKQSRQLAPQIRIK